MAYVQVDEEVIDDIINVIRCTMPNTMGKNIKNFAVSYYTDAIPKKHEKPVETNNYIDDTLTELPSQYFASSYFQKNLQSVSLPKCTKINTGAFYNCSSLKSITLPFTTVSYIGDFAFAGTSPTWITASSASFSQMMASCSHVGSYAFNNMGIDVGQYMSNNLPNMQYIGENAFHYSSTLTGLALGKCEYLGKDVINVPTNIAAPNFPLMKYIGKNNFPSCMFSTLALPWVENIDDNAFYFVSSAVNNLNFPKCRRIGDNAFHTFNAKLTLTLADCDYIGDEAFQCNLGIASVVAPRIKYIGNSAIWNKSTTVTNFASISFPECEHFGTNMCSGNVTLVNVTMPKCKYIGDYAFYNNVKLSVATLSNMPKCEYIGASAFYNCSLLTSVDLPECKEIGAFGFDNCTKITTVNLPKCDKIKPSTFRGCTDLITANLPQCSIIGMSAFANCTNLSTVNLPECGRIDIQAFYSCSNAVVNLLSTEVATIYDFNVKQYMVPAILYNNYISKYSLSRDKFAIYYTN